MQITIKTNELQAMLLTAAKKDVRYYLNGVFVHIQPELIRLVSTDGSHMSVLRVEHDKVNGAAEIIIPRDIIAGLDKKGGVVILEDQPDGKWRITEHTGRVTQFSPIDGKFPDFRRVMPVNLDGQATQIDPELLVDFKKLGKAIGTKQYMEVTHSSSGNCLVSFMDAPNFIGVVMGWRTRKLENGPIPTDAPYWSRQ